jgi:hypothetical protein
VLIAPLDRGKDFPPKFLRRLHPPAVPPPHHLPVEVHAPHRAVQELAREADIHRRLLLIPRQHPDRNARLTELRDRPRDAHLRAYQKRKRNTFEQMNKQTNKRSTMMFATC